MENKAEIELFRIDRYENDKNNIKVSLDVDLGNLIIETKDNKVVLDKKNTDKIRDALNANNIRFEVAEHLKNYLRKQYNVPMPVLNTFMTENKLSQKFVEFVDDICKKVVDKFNETSSKYKNQGIDYIIDNLYKETYALRECFMGLTDFELDYKKALMDMYNKKFYYNTEPIECKISEQEKEKDITSVDVYVIYRDNTSIESNIDELANILIDTVPIDRILNLSIDENCISLRLNATDLIIPSVEIAKKLSLGNFAEFDCDKLVFFQSNYKGDIDFNLVSNGKLGYDDFSVIIKDMSFNREAVSSENSMPFKVDMCFIDNNASHNGFNMKFSYDEVNSYTINLLNNMIKNKQNYKTLTDFYNDHFNKEEEQERE